MDGMDKQRRPRRAFTPEFKAEIVEVCRRGDRSIGQVAKDFDLTETAVRDVDQVGPDNVVVPERRHLEVEPVEEAEGAELDQP